MSNYVNREDIDRLMNIVNEINILLEKKGATNIQELLSRYYDQSEFDAVTSKVDNDLNVLDNSLSTLKNDLIRFNAGLIEFDEDSSHLDTDLSKLKENLLGFVEALGLLDVDLIELESSLTTLNGQVNGDATHTGFLTYVQQLQTYMYGGEGHSMADPTPNSLKGTLDQFSQELADLDAGDTKLSMTLSALTGYLTTFKGTLSEFQAQIVADKGQSFYDGLDGEIIKLIGAITSANQDIETHQDLIDDVQSTIGEDGDTGDDTLFGLLYNTDQTANQASSSATAVTNTVNNTVTPRLNKVINTDIPDVKNKIGYNSIGNTNLQAQITAQNEDIGDLNSEVTDVKDAVGYDIIGNVDLQTQITTTNGVASTANSNASTALNTANEVSQTIGDKSQLKSTTLIGGINKVIDDIGDVQDDIGDMSQLSDDLASSINNAQGNIDTVKNTTIPLVKEKIGYSQIGDTDLQTQILNSNEFLNLLNQSIATLLKPNSEYTKIYYCSGVPDTQELLILESDYGYDTSSIQYAISENGTQYVRQGAGWVAQEIPSSAYAHSIGVRASFSERRQDGFNPDFSYVYSVSTNEYFELRRS